MNEIVKWVGLAVLLFAVACGNSNKNDGDDTDDPDGGPGPGGTPEGLECENPEDAGDFAYDSIPTWRDGATAAYTMFHDDLCDYGVRGIQENAVPALNERGVVAGLGAIAYECEAGSHWEMVAELEQDGHEIMNHSYDHDAVSVENASEEVVQSKAIFDKHLASPISFYIFPYDYFTADTISAVLSAGHIGARGGDRDDNNGFDDPPINSAEPGDDGEVEFDVWPRTYSKYALYYPEDILTVHLWHAIKAGGWATREFHSVIEDGEPEEGNGFGPIYLSDYEKHLDDLVDAYNKNVVWTANPSTVIRYRHARKACGASVSDDELAYDTSSSECTEFATHISVIVTTENDVPSIEGMQGDTAVYTRKLSANTYAVTADPTAGPVTLSGCADEGYSVESGDIVPEPTPAESVCDIETVVGTGSPGMMDDLERPFDEFQVLPNPSQGDGRTGSWSWYPQTAVVEMMDEGGNTILSYSGSNLDAWTGVSLAFLGGNGAGTCYDANAYNGIRFRIKGSVSSSDELNGKVILSLITAETQTQTYGGDLDGEGGHFNSIVDVTSSWQTVTLTWDQFNTPTWGDTQSLTDPAIHAMQALDWGISNVATTFQIYLDDIELI